MKLTKEQQKQAKRDYERYAITLQEVLEPTRRLLEEQLNRPVSLEHQPINKISETGLYQLSVFCIAHGSGHGESTLLFDAIIFVKVEERVTTDDITIYVQPQDITKIHLTKSLESKLKEIITKDIDLARHDFTHINIGMRIEFEEK